MWKTIPILILILGGLMYWDSALSQKEILSRRSSSRVRQLIPKELREGESQRVAALKLEDPGHKEAFVYAREKDAWRCVSRFRAIADEGKIKSLIDKLLNSQGIVQMKEAARAPDYGLGEGSVLHLSLHGPKVFEDRREDLLHAFDVGLPVPGATGCYVRLSGSAEIIAMDANLREELAPPAIAGIPPLVDLHIIPPVGLGNTGTQRIVIRRADGEKFELLRREKRISPEEMKAGQLPWDWILKRNDREETCPPGPSNAFATFLLRAPFLAILDPKTLPQLGLEKPSVKLALYPSEGKPVEVSVGSKRPNGRVPVHNELTQSLFEASSEVADLLAPRADELALGPNQAEATAGNPWEAFLRR
jgi:hypothetical protein